MRPNNQRIWTITLLFVVTSTYTFQKLVAQSPNLGLPVVHNYDKQDYSFGADNWDVEAYDQHLVFANKAGLLLYNGKDWQHHLTPLNTVLRSIEVNHDTIWVGGQGELGYFRPNSSGVLTYSSITDESYLKDQNLQEIWDLTFVNSTLYYRNGTSHIHAIKNGTITKYGSGKLVSKLAPIGDEVWFSEIGVGLFKIDKTGKTIQIAGDEIIKSMDIAEILEFNGNAYVFTANNGIWIYQNEQFIQWDTNAEQYLADKRIKCATTYQDDLIIVGTRLGGIAIINKNGTTKHVIEKKHGLLNNEINNLYVSPTGMVWTANNNGIDEFALTDGHYVFYPDGELEGAVYDVIRWEGDLFFCTSNGLYTINEQQYYSPFQALSFKLIEGSIGQNWGLDIIDDELFLAHASGAYQVKKDLSLVPILQEGTWKYVKLDDGVIAIGTYTGVYIVKKQNGSWQETSKISGLNESSRIMLYDNDKNLWVSHPYKKVYRINLDENYNSSKVKEYEKSSGFHSDSRNYVYNVNGQCTLTNETGTYQYNAAEDNFDRYLQMDTVTHLHVKRLIPAKDDNMYWTISTDGTRLLTINDDKSIDVNAFVSQDRVDQSDYIGGFENLYALDNDNILMCTTKGVSKVYSDISSDEVPEPYFTTISLPSSNDSIIYGGVGELSHLDLHKRCSDIRFDFAGPYRSSGQYRYSYLMEGVDKDWSYPSESTTKEYTNLNHGDYTFNMRIVGPFGQTSNTVQSMITIETPWHKSMVAYVLYGLIFLIVLGSMLLIPRKQYKKTTALLETEKKNTELEMERLKKESELELETLKSEKLENEILFKNKELAMSTMHLLQKSETLTAIRTEVEKIVSKIKDQEAKKEVRKIISLLRDDDRVEDDWKNFSIHYDQANHNFLKRLKSEYPVLTPKDQKLCAYLRMNLTTKDIAPLLNISVRGVEIARYRLRKKINLDKEVNLNSYMMDY